jgi:type I restriction enzyme, S subunit
MQTLVNTRINFIDLIHLENWSVQALLDSNVNYSNRFGLAKIGEFLIKNRNVESIDDDKIYRRVTVKVNNNGVILRNIEKGINIGTKKQFIAKSGQFIVSKIDARNGAFGIIPPELDGAIVTNDFPLFDVNEKKINPHFLLLITTTKEFIKFAQSCSSGTTNRQRMDIDLFLNQKIPLPSIAEQNKIVDNYNKKIREAEQLEQSANVLESEIDKYLTGKLGIENTINKKHSGLYFANLFEITRWDIWNKSTQLNNSDMRIVPLHNIIKMKSGNFLPASKMEKGEYNVYGGNGKNGMHNSYTYEGKRLVIGRVGEYCGNVHLVDGKYWITDNAFVVDKVSNEVSYEFLAIVLKQLNLNKYKVLSAQPSISQSSILSLEMPLPSAEIQNKIVETITKEKEAIERMRSLSISIKVAAEKRFESVIFNL